MTIAESLFERANAPACAEADVMMAASADVLQLVFVATELLLLKSVSTGWARTPVTPNGVRPGPTPRTRTRFDTPGGTTKPAISVLTSAPAAARVAMLSNFWPAVAPERSY